eukprot:6003832-Ditylum_brightwellii.AAC.1
MSGRGSLVGMAKGSPAKASLEKSNSRAGQAHNSQEGLCVQDGRSARGRAHGQDVYKVQYK